MKKLTIHHLDQEQLDELGIDDANPGWYIHDPNNPCVEWVGEYHTKADAQADKVGLTRFYRSLKNDKNSKAD